jgi:hypothetical protein
MGERSRGQLLLDAGETIAVWKVRVGQAFLLATRVN